MQLPSNQWSPRKSLFLLLLDWAIASAAFALARSMDHYTGDSIVPKLVSVVAVTVAAVAFVGAPIVVAKRSGEMKWLLGFVVAALLIGGFLSLRAEYHHVRSMHALAKVRTAVRAAQQVTKIAPPPLLSSLPRYQDNPQRWRVAKAQAASRYTQAISSAEPALARSQITILKVLPAASFLPQFDIRVGTLTFCYTPVPLQGQGAGVILGTCEQPDWDTMDLVFP